MIDWLTVFCLLDWLIEWWIGFASIEKIEDREGTADSFPKFNLEDRINYISTRSIQYLKLRHSYFWIRGLPVPSRMLLNNHTWKENLFQNVTNTESIFNILVRKIQALTI